MGTTGEAQSMLVPLAEAAVATGVIDAAGFVVGVGGILATALWLRALYR